MLAAIATISGARGGGATAGERLSLAQYKRALAQIDRNARRRPTYDLFDQNCNSFVGVVARSAGILVPSATFVLPAEYVRGIRELNAGRR